MSDELLLSSFQVNVIDINDNCPEFSETYFALSPYPSLQRNPIINLTAIDIDSGVNGQIKYYVSTYHHE